ncbi:hypothetical protein [Paenibacillus sp. DCT19]|nr:hypothetical protein [Paenibacillus sp. DCT19]
MFSSGKFTATSTRITKRGLKIKRIRRSFYVQGIPEFFL